MEEKTCPECGEPVPIASGFRNWCRHCDWNLGADVADPDALGWYASYSQRAGNRLFESLANASHDALRSSTASSRIGAWLFAGVVHLITVAIFLAGAWLIYFDWFNWFLTITGALFILLSVALFPRPDRMQFEPVSAEEAPALHAATGRVAELLEAPAMPLINITPDINASIGYVGWRRVPCLRIGAPLWLCLDQQQKLALLAHELSHQVNNDIARGFWVGSAEMTLARWYDFLHTPYNPDAHIGEIIAHYLMRLASWVILLLYWGLAYLHFSDSQRSEYLADYLGSRISGSEPFIALNERVSVILQNAGKLDLCARRHPRNPEHIIPAFVAEFERVPDSEIERVLRLDRQQLFSLDATHPPTHYRSELLRRFPVEPALTFSDDENRRMNEEVAAFNRPMGEFLLASR